MMTAMQMVKEVQAMINVEEDAGMLPGYQKFKHPDGREDVFDPKGNKVVDGEVACLHKQCPECHGTGRDKIGNACIHMISCPCPAHSPRMSV